MSVDENQADAQTVERSDAAVPKRFQSRPNSDDVDPQLIHETKNQIRSLVQEIRDLAHSECSREEFYQGFLSRVIGALASVGGAIWIKDEQGKLRLEYHANLKQTQLQEDPQKQQEHGRLLESLLQSGQPALVPPHSGDQREQSASNPTEHLLVIGPLTSENEVDGLVEIFQRPGGGPTTQRGYLRFLVQMCEIASGFLKNQKLKDFSAHQQTWQKLERYVHQIHQGLDTRKTLYTIANEGRQFVNCERVSVALKQGRKLRIEAVSGLDTIERRAEQIKLLSKLVSRVTRADMELWYEGEAEPLPPQIETCLQDYVDLSHAKSIAVLPLRTPEDASTTDKKSGRRSRQLGALVFEQMNDDRFSAAMKSRCQVVQQHGSDALTNSLQHNRIILLPLLRLIGAVPGVQASRSIPKWAMALALLAGLVAAMCWIPYDFSLASNGKLVPETRYEIYAPSDGIVVDILAPDDPDVVVEPNQLLAVMKNPDLESEIEGLNGQLKIEVEHEKKLFRTYNQKLDERDRFEVRGEITKSQQLQASLKRKLKLRTLRLEQLKLRSPARGQIVNWQLRENLIRRPVKQGQSLMTVVDPETDWLLEIEVPERRVQHLMRQVEQSEGEVKVTFTLASHPGESYQGRIVEIDPQMGVYSDEGTASLVRVAFEKKDVPQDLLRSGTRVTAKIQCGERPLGYVLFHELYETVQAKVLFWF